MNGILVLNKPCGISSHRAVALCRRLTGEPKIGHTGTLDPEASGVLPLLCGNARKAAQFLLAEDKAYEATFRVGVSTETGDFTGAVREKSAVRPDLAAWQGAAREFLGVSEQIPPMYAALKQNGVPLYRLARQGKTVPRAPRRVEIHDIELSKTEDADVFFLSVSCSKGTYIRTLIEDIAARAGTLATMLSLCRTRCGDFTLQNAVTLEALERRCENGSVPAELLLPVESCFSSWERVELSAFYARLAKCGAEIYPERAGITLPLALGQRLLLIDENGAFFAFGELREFPEGCAVKPIKLFL